MNEQISENETTQGIARGGDCCSNDLLCNMEFWESGWGRLFDKHFANKPVKHDKKTARIYRGMQRSSDRLLWEKCYRPKGYHAAK